MIRNSEALETGLCARSKVFLFGASYEWYVKINLIELAMRVVTYKTDLRTKLSLKDVGQN